MAIWKETYIRNKTRTDNWMDNRKNSITGWENDR